ncbi:hypothetical protein [Agitococcus lubricus]|uniref:START domain-containing protein n=1 Tax=Agitococcus lubricus TaxID=1077255 RepID=A0A2T5IY64_9GAMM|nr:hypothetical protein [Agitococcus lubricus]PTQ88902.1 hypothetical protein C8N29_11051 [Agitococcus lubricus]
MSFVLSRFSALLCAFWLVLSSTSVYADKNELDDLRSQVGRDWVLVKNDRLRNIKTYVRLEDGKQYRSFKVEAILDCTVDALAHVLLDFDNYTKWYWKTRESRLLEQKSATEYIVYMVHEAPYGIPDRDVVIKGVIEPQTKTKRALTLKVSAFPEYLPPKPPLVRMPAEDMSVKFSPLPNNRIQLEAEGYFDAGGTVPAWAANFVQRSAPYSVVLGLQRMVSLDEYRKSKKALAFPIYDYDDYK